MKERVTLKPGDYVSTEGMDEELYEELAAAFMEAGCKGPVQEFEYVTKSHLFGWSKAFGQLGHNKTPCPSFSRRLTHDQVLGITSAGGQTQDTMTTILESAAEHDAKAKHHAAEHDRLMQHARDMLPDGWMLVRGGVDWAKGEDMYDQANWREGDVIEWIEDSSNFFTAGKRYTILAPENPEEDDFDVIDDDNERHAWDFAPAGKSFRFHSRPTT